MKRLLLFAALILAAAGCSKDDTSTPSGWDGTPATEFANGNYDDGTNDYDIATASQLAYLAELVNDGKTMSDKTFTLTADIYLNNVEWTPIGKSTSFKGTFDGDGYTISGLKIDNDANYYIGLFGYVIGGTIKNISVAGSVKGSRDEVCVGGVVGYAYSSSTIINCCSSGSVTVAGGMDVSVGGVVGEANNSTITNCYSSSSVTGNSNTNIGGVVGCANASSTIITNCYSSGSVTGGTNIGGVVGYVDSGSTITSCYWNNSIYTGSGIGFGSGTATGKSTSEMKESSFVTTLNNNAYTYNNDGPPSVTACAWKSVSNGYPTLNFGGTPSYTNLE